MPRNKYYKAPELEFFYRIPRIEKLLCRHCVQPYRTTSQDFNIPKHKPYTQQMDYAAGIYLTLII